MDGYTMHSAQSLASCSELCIPTILSDIRYSVGWKCGPCSIQHQGTNSVYNNNNNNIPTTVAGLIGAGGGGKMMMTVTIQRPVTSAPDDLLLLFLSRTDDLLPLRLDGWETGPVCLKSFNEQEKCHRVKDCKKWDGDYCLEFGGVKGGSKSKEDEEDNDGLDLATAVFYRTVQPNGDEPLFYTFTLPCADENECFPAWAILTALRGAHNDDPIYDSATESFDEVSESVFPSVCGDAGDMLLLHMAFDDGFTSGTSLFNFLPPPGTSWLGQVIGVDEAGFLFGEVLESSGETGSRSTTGLGEDASKDAMISLIVRKRKEKK